MSTLLKTGVSLRSRAINSTIREKLIDKGINSIPNIFRFGRKKLKNKKLKKILKSDVADLVVNETQKSQAKVRRFILNDGGNFKWTNQKSV